jgi:acetyl/propionyl-CoA carboxylase alpha subunit
MTRSISRNTSAAPPYRGAGLRRRQGRRGASGRARLFAAAAPPEGAGGGPRPSIDAETRARIGATCAKAIGDLGYEGAGTIEFLYEDGEFYFIEMNTRLQVEHPVTEAIFGVDLVREQIRVAAGMNRCPSRQDDLNVNGHAIEVRINAEKLPNFSPCPGRITQYHAPGGLGIRMDSALYDGYSIPPYYDSLIAKLIVHGRDRPEALARLNRALGELIVDGIDTTVPLFHALLQEPDIQLGPTRSTGWKTGFRATWAEVGPAPAKIILSEIRGFAVQGRVEAPGRENLAWTVLLRHYAARHVSPDTSPAQPHADAAGLCGRHFPDVRRRG